jgi:hypothetical protein
MVIGAEFGRDDHDSMIPTNAIGRGLKPFDERTDPQTRKAKKKEFK